MFSNIFIKSFFKPSKSFGGAAIEYIIVSTFAAVISLTAVSFISKIFKDRVTKMSDKLEMSETVDPSEFDNF